eukprot:TRINITY_DN32961_c0_g1_i1.p1 TRINITY_DN32961_c0_g1~~TRINITY_DN32961_c0_g1_i1.p1  ORF type:complete len:251 (-),score=60.92 TRINITY_DN32961_c0_g1_i1:35-787(-)
MRERDEAVMPRRAGRCQGDILIVGLTGSIGMGKSTVSKWLRELGVPVDDADATVHQLYAPGGAAVEPIRQALGSEAIAEDGSVSRPALSKLVMGEENKGRLQKLEAIVHPLVESLRDDFIADARKRGELLCILDIPLLFEKKLDRLCDLVTVASASSQQQRQRVLARPGMTVEKFEGILAKQVPDAEKRRMADEVLDTGASMEETRAQVVAFVERCRQQVASERRRRALMIGAGLAGLAALAVTLFRKSR